MFGYIITNTELLDEEDKKYYAAFYCGLCEALGKRHKASSKLTLNYDMTFLAILLNEVYKNKYEIEESETRCLLHPIKKHTYFQNELIDYVADMNVLLSYYNLIDDWNDDRNIISGSYAKVLENEFEKVSRKYPQKAEIVKQKLEELSDFEHQNVMIPDLPAQCCGAFFGEIFAPFDDENANNLRELGDSLGKFIYILDACIDLKDDIKHKNYNPLITSSKDKFDDMLNLLMADVIECYKKLNISNNILENILYSGIWSKYEIYRKKGEKK